MGISSNLHHHTGEHPQPTQDQHRVLRDLLVDVTNDSDRWTTVLLAEHRSLCDLVHHYVAGEVELEHVPAPIHEHLRRLSRAFMAALQAEAFEGTAIRSASALIAYLRQDMACLRRESFRVLFLDGENRLLADRTLWTGTIDSVEVHPREIARILLDLDATAIILVHNHPSGQTTPSWADLKVTRQMAELCSAIRVTLQDHVIVGRSGCHSMRSSGELGEMERELQERDHQRKMAA